MRQNRINIKGSSISYYETRDNGKTVVFVHGISSSSSIFIRQLIDSVISYQFRFIALDLIGYGNSDASKKPEEDYTINGLSNFLVEFCEALNLKDAIFIGHDIGGNIILDAYESLKNPKGLILLGSVPFVHPFDENVFTKKAVVDLLSKAGVDSSEVHQIASLFVEEDTQYPDFIPEIIRKADLKTREVFFKSLNEGKYKDQHNIMNNIKEPIALYCGEFDQMINNERIKDIKASNIWKEMVHEIKDSGHMFFYESPADFNISLESYLNTVFK